MTRIPDRIVERVHLGEATPVERERVMADPEARARLEALPAQDRAFLAAWPAEVVVPQIERKLKRATAVAQREQSPSWGRGLLVLAPVLAVILAVVLVSRAPEAPDELLEETTAKGLQPSLQLFTPATDGALPLSPDQTLQAGDVIQVGWQAGDATHGVIVSIDGSGAVTLHFPHAAGDSTLLPTGEQHAPEAFRLDDAPSFERFFFVTANEPIDTGAVVAAAERLARGDARTGDLPLEPSLHQSSQIVRKDGP
jgi:hypothetical protein